MVGWRPVIECGQRPWDGGVGLLAVPDRGSHREDALGDPGGDAFEGASTVLFEVQLLVVWLLLATVEFAAHRLPDVLTLPLAVAALVLLGVAAVLPGTGGSWTSALLGSLILGAYYFVLFLISQGFGFGDVKLALVPGTVMGWYGWAIVLVGTFSGYTLGALYGVGLMLAGRADRTTRIPFGPSCSPGRWRSTCRRRAWDMRTGMRDQS